MAEFNETVTNPAYWCGAFVAEAEDIQKAAIGRDIGVTSARKYFSLAMNRPATAMGILGAECHQHLAKLGRDRPGLQHWFEEHLQTISSHLPAELPQHLNLQDRGVFTLGYYAWRASKKTAVKSE